MIPLDVGSDYDQSVRVRPYVAESELGIRRERGNRPSPARWQPMASVSELDDGAAVKANVMTTLDTDVFMTTPEQGEGLAATAVSGASNAVVNTQNNTESFQAGKSALARDEHQHRQEPLCAR